MTIYQPWLLSSSIVIFFPANFQFNSIRSRGHLDLSIQDSSRLEMIGEKKLLKVSFSFIYMIFVSFIVLCFVLCQWKSKKKKWKLTHKWSNVNNENRNRKMVIFFLGCFDHEINKNDYDDLVRSCVHHVYV